MRNPIAEHHAAFQSPRDRATTALGFHHDTPRSVRRQLPDPRAGVLIDRKGSLVHTNIYDVLTDPTTTTTRRQAKSHLSTETFYVEP
uniref:Penicillin-binding protein n=1 Tax=Mesocestoides corti TaxID=53468 RepID=A0A5K3FXC8_MESCO